MLLFNVSSPTHDQIINNMTDELWDQMIKPDEEIPDIMKHFPITITRPLKLSGGEVSVRLNKREFMVTQKGMADEPYEPPYHNHFDNGTYACLVCKAPIFSSTQKVHWDGEITDAPIFQGYPLSKVDYQTADYHRDVVNAYCGDCGSELGDVFENRKGPAGFQHFLFTSSL